TASLALEVPVPAKLRALAATGPMESRLRVAEPTVPELSVPQIGVDCSRTRPVVASSATEVAVFVPTPTASICEPTEIAWGGTEGTLAPSWVIRVFELTVTVPVGKYVKQMLLVQ